MKELKRNQERTKEHQLSPPPAPSKIYPRNLSKEGVEFKIIILLREKIELYSS